MQVYSPLNFFCNNYNFFVERKYRLVFFSFRKNKGTYRWFWLRVTCYPSQALWLHCHKWLHLPVLRNGEMRGSLTTPCYLKAKTGVGQLNKPKDQQKIKLGHVLLIGHNIWTPLSRQLANKVKCNKIPTTRQFSNLSDQSQFLLKLTRGKAISATAEVLSMNFTSDISFA